MSEINHPEHYQGDIEVIDIIRMDERIERLKQSIEAEKEYIKMVTIIDYKDTKKLLGALNQILLYGVEVDDVIDYLDAIAKLSR